MQKLSFEFEVHPPDSAPKDGSPIMGIFHPKGRADKQQIPYYHPAFWDEEKGFWIAVIHGWYSNILIGEGNPRKPQWNFYWRDHEFDLIGWFELSTDLPELPDLLK